MTPLDRAERQCLIAGVGLPLILLLISYWLSH
ncbi:hypothetical protein FHW69_001637 [Luteibacter sp. Sphag1AF]|nr:hypothetical protein [Luteibacter sp. Sphag1AF]